MSAAADAWDLTVPGDPSELLAALRSHGIEPGERILVMVDSGHRSSEELRAAITRMSKAIEVLDSASSTRIASLLGPHLEALEDLTSSLSASASATKAVELDDPLLADALEQLQDSLAAAIAAANKSQSSAADKPVRPRRSFAFAASFSAEPDLARRTDDYLTRGFGRP